MNRGDARDGGVNKTAKLGESRSLSQSESSPSLSWRLHFHPACPGLPPRTASRLLIRCTRMTCRTSTCHQSTTEVLLCRRIQVEHESMLLHDTMLEQYALAKLGCCGCFETSRKSVSVDERIPMAQESRTQAAVVSDACHYCMPPMKAH